MKERRLDFFAELERYPKTERFLRFMEFRLAPVTAGVKPAELITLCAGGGYTPYELWTREGPGLIEKQGLEFRYLRNKDECACIIAFRRAILQDALVEEEAAKELATAGYERGWNLEQNIDELASRFETSCPHESGLFLGIPSRDVRTFIEQKGKNYLFEGYWKVYHNPERAKRTFHLWDEERNRIARLTTAS